MKNIVTGLIGCILGGSIGGFVGYKLAQKKYYKLADKEVKEVTKFYEDKLAEAAKTIEDLVNDNNGMAKVLKMEDMGKKGPKKKEAKSKNESNGLPDNQVSSIIKPTEEERKNYTDYTKPYNKMPNKQKEVSKADPRPDLVAEQKIDENKFIEIITPEEYGDSYYNYYKETLYYYQDGILADESDNPIYDIENTVGPEALFTFGRYEDDATYVRNHQKEVDYEIRLCERKFKDIAAGKSGEYSPEDE
jgi:gas vesicle protein